MTYISPILSNSLKQNNKSKKQSESHYNKIYEELTRHANDVKPNAPKAKLIKGGPAHAVKNTIKDGKNFFKAVKDGKLSDNNLGRINDLGMKLGALTIASFLASRAKTKTDAIMQFVGGATFFASMSLWPKLFINLPARIVHGFDIGQKYVSAQGDEKDFFLDNQFLPWDAYSKDELRKIGKRTGIDYDSPNGEEKIQRKMQKTALQNRTLWMATAGFATPLLTAMFGNFVEPKVKNAVIEKGYKKALDIVTPKLFYEQDGTGVPKTGLADYLANSKTDVRNVAGIDKLFKKYSNGVLDDKFYSELATLLELNSAQDSVQGKGEETIKRIYQMFKDPDDYEPIKKLHITTPFVDELKNIQAETAIVEPNSLENALKGFRKPIKEANSFVMNGSVTSTPKEVRLDVAKIMQEFKESADKTLAGLKTVLKNNGINNEEDFEIISKSLSFDNSKFFETIKEYNETVLPEIRGRFKSYMNLFNSVMGSKTESKTTQLYLNEIDTILKRLNFNYKDLKVVSENGILAQKTQGYLTKYFSDFAQRTQNLNPEEYKKALKEFLSISFDSDLLQAMDTLVDPNNVQSIVDGAKAAGDNSIFKRLNNVIIGTKNQIGGLANTLLNFRNCKQDSVEAIKAKSLICINFERRVANGEFKKALKEAKLISEDVLKDDTLDYNRLLEYARSTVYDGTSAKDACNGNIGSAAGDFYKKLRETIYNPEFFNTEAEFLKETANSVDNKKLIPFDLKKIVKGLGSLNESEIPKRDYLKSLSFSQAVTKRATEIFNNKSWARIFVPMTAALIAVTLLVQPFFGKIDKEFPDENKNGGAK